MGNALALPAVHDVRRYAEQARAESVAGRGPVRLEAAYFGGTFTALSLELQHKYLGAAAALKAEGVIDAVRVSTHPSYVDREIADRLSASGVDTVELGIQSFADRVLTRCGRGYDETEARSACREVKAAGLDLVVQLMPFLPGADENDDLCSARVTAALEPGAVRIFPTVVIEGTRLHGWWQQGDYRAATVPDAVDRVAKMLKIIVSAHIPVIRIGLQVSEVTDGAVVAGPYHPALGELCHSGLLVDVIAEHAGGDDLAVIVDPALASLLTGHGRAGETRLESLLPARRVTVEVGDASAAPPEAETVWSCDRFMLMKYNKVAYVKRRTAHGADG